MATLNVSQNGVTFDSAGDALSNASAIVDLFETDASAGDTINFDGAPGDTVWVDTDDADLARMVDLNGSNIPDNLTVTGPTDANNEPGVTIRAVDSVSVGFYMFELTVRDGMSLTVENLEFDGNNRNNGNCAIPWIHRDGEANNILFENVDFRNGDDVSWRELDGTGATCRHCTFRETTDNHGAAATHRNVSGTAYTTTFEDCLFRDCNGPGGAYGLNSSPGKVVARDCVVQNCRQGFKIGTDPSASASYDTEHIRCRIDNPTDFGIFILADGTVHDATVTFEDLIIDNPGDEGILTGGSADNDELISVASNSTLLISSATDNGMQLRGNSQIETLSGAEIEICDSGQWAVNYDSDKNSTIDDLNASGNANGATDDSDGAGTLTVGSLTSSSCPSDISGVPTASEVGVGTQTSGDEETQTQGLECDGQGLVCLGQGIIAGGVGSINGGSTGSGGVTTEDADYWVDPVNGSSSNTGTSQNDAFASIYEFDENGSVTLQPGDSVACLPGTDTLSDRLSLSQIGERDTPGTVKFADEGVSRNGNPITIGTWADATSDYVVDGTNLAQNQTGILLFDADNIDFRGHIDSWFVVENIPNHAIKLQGGSGQLMQQGEWEYVECRHYGLDSTDDGGNAYWVNEGVRDGHVHDCRFHDGSEPADSDGVYYGGPAGNRPGGTLFERVYCWDNADDGFDFYRADSTNPVELRYCLAYANGSDESGNNEGDGNGFKMGGDSGGGAYIEYCLAWANKGRLVDGDGSLAGNGFNDNGIPDNNYWGCGAWDNQEWGFRAATNETYVLNSWAFGNGDGPDDGSATTINNSWNLGITVTTSDFESTDPAQDDVFVPVSGSALVDAGIVLDGYTLGSGPESGATIDTEADPPYGFVESFEGNSPDLGYAETGTTPLADSGGGGGGGGDTTTSLGFGGGLGAQFGGGIGGSFGGGR